MTSGPFRQPFRSVLETIQVSAVAILRLPLNALAVPEGYEDDHGFHYGAPGARETARVRGADDRPSVLNPRMAHRFCQRIAVLGAFPREALPGSN